MCQNRKVQSIRCRIATEKTRGRTKNENERIKCKSRLKKSNSKVINVLLMGKKYFYIKNGNKYSYLR